MDIGSKNRPAVAVEDSLPRRLRCFTVCAAMTLLAALVLTGCSTPAVRQQRLVAKPNMTFSDVTVFSYNAPGLLSQVATGFAGAGAAQNSGCTSCR